MPQSMIHNICLQNANINRFRAINYKKMFYLKHSAKSELQHLKISGSKSNFSDPPQSTKLNSYY